MNKNMIAVGALVLALVAFGMQVYTKNSMFFAIAIAFMLVGVSMTPRKK